RRYEGNFHDPSPNLGVAAAARTECLFPEVQDILIEQPECFGLLDLGVEPHRGFDVPMAQYPPQSVELTGIPLSRSAASQVAEQMNVELDAQLSMYNPTD